MRKYRVVIVSVDLSSYINDVNMSSEQAVDLEDFLEHDERIMWSSVGLPETKGMSYAELKKDLKEHFGLNI